MPSDNVTSRLSTTLKTRVSPGFTATDFFNKPGKVGHAGGRIGDVCVMVVAMGVNADWQREILDMAVGASGVEMVTSDAHQGLKNVIAVVFAGAS